MKITSRALRRCVGIALALVASSVSAESNSADFERILVPLVATRQPGAFGSFWTTELFARHSSQIDIVLGYDYGDDPQLIAPDTTYSPKLFERQAGEPDGAFLYIRRSASASSHFSLISRDASRDDSGGVNIPVVREHQFRSGPAFLLHVPGGEQFRRTLRVYDCSGTTSSFRIRAFDDASQRPVGSTTVSLVESSRSLVGGLPMRPAAIALDVSSLFPEIGPAGAITIEISPQADTIRWWAFASVTNNVTQEVTIVVP